MKPSLPAHDASVLLSTLLKRKGETVDISKLNKAAVLAALYNGSRQQGMGFMNARGGSGMTVEQAQDAIDAQGTYFDYLYGRVLKIDLSEDDLYTGLYNRDNGQGAAERIIEELRKNAA